MTNRLELEVANDEKAIKSSDDDEDFQIIDRRSSFSSFSSPVGDCMVFPGAVSEDDEPSSEHDLE